MKKNIFTLAALLIASAAFIACSSSNDDITEQKPVSQTGKYIMTVKASKGDDAATRALSLSGSTLNATWADGEEVSVFEGSTPLGTLRPDPTTISNNDTECTCTLSGTLDTAPSASGVTLTLKFNSASYSGQDGTLATIASTCDYAEATTKVTVTTTNNVTTIEGTTANFVNKQAIAKFTLKDKVYGDELNASKLIVTVDVSDDIKATLSAQQLAALQAQLPTYELEPTTDTYTQNGGTDILFLAIPDATTKLAAINNQISSASLSTSDLKFVLTATVDGDTYTLTKNGFPFENGKYYEITTKLTMQPEGALRGKFSVSSGKKVHFSKSNLQATTSNNGTTWTWHFGPNQKARVGNGVANTAINGNGTVTDAGNGKNIDLFGWSTSTTHLGINKSTTNTDYRTGSVTNGSDFVDWGSASEVTACIGTGWRTLTSNEWRYLMVTRSGNRYAKASINGNRAGFIILPDGWTNTSPHTLNNINDDSAEFNSNSISDADWTNNYEKYGAVFLPVTGQRSGTTVNNPDSELHYWSSTGGENSSHVPTGNHLRYIDSGNSQGLAPDAGAGRCNGYAVRLVRDIE